ncbi:hypothetical protein ACFPZ4_30295, partial [Micromonospora harpali]
MTARHDLWRPVSGCDAGCLPGPGETAAVPVARRLGRLVAVLLMLAAGALLAGLLPVLTGQERRAALLGWARGATRAHAALLPKVVGPARETLALIGAKLPGQQRAGRQHQEYGGQPP